MGGREGGGGGQNPPKHAEPVRPAARDPTEQRLDAHGDVPHAHAKRPHDEQMVRGQGDGERGQRRLGGVLVLDRRVLESRARGLSPPPPPSHLRLGRLLCHAAVLRALTALLVLLVVVAGTVGLERSGCRVDAFAGREWLAHRRLGEDDRLDDRRPVAL